MDQLEDKKNPITKEPEYSAEKAGRRRSGDSIGVASTFDRKGLNNFFVNYLTTMLVVEGLIFFFCFVNHLVGNTSEFPWKNYLFATFVTPIAMTFVFGLIILTFNKYFFRTSDEPDSSLFSTYHRRKGDRLEAFFHIVHRLPFLFSLLLLIAATAVAYKMDAIVLYAAQAGAVTARYLFIALAVVMAVIALGVGTWMILSYRLRQKTLSSEHQYRMQLMDQFGMVMLDDGTMLNKDGEVVYQRGAGRQLDYTESEQVQLVEESSKQD